MASRLWKLLVTMGLVASFLLAGATAATAACHSFDLEVSPSSVAEGGQVQVTVSRDGAVADSGVKVTAAGGTARSGIDFTSASTSRSTLRATPPNARFRFR